MANHRRDFLKLSAALAAGLALTRANHAAASPATGLADHDAIVIDGKLVPAFGAAGGKLDLSHCDETSTLAALAAAGKPALITHAGCAAVYAHPRNKSDRVLRAAATKGGVVGIYDLSFLVRAPRQPNLDDYLRHRVHALDICGEDHVGIGSAMPC